MNDLMKLLWCTGGGMGLLPKAPGTWGSLKPILAILIFGYLGAPRVLIIILLLLIIVIASSVTIILAPWYENYFGEKDPPQVVSDEAVGQSIALLGMTWLEPNNHISTGIWIGLIILAFVLFRVFDIWKPSVINTIQQLRGGWGVLMDDILAGIAAGILVFITAVLIG
ncbi:phosphatidylglycerophosphatase A [PVC group bacterium]|nr:phosphatidylglycerophosphatase A [PVC group bacterium]